MADQIIVAWKRREELTDGEHLLDGYFDFLMGDDTSRVEFEGRTYAKVMGEFASVARQHPSASLAVIRLDQQPQPVVMGIDEKMSELLRTDPVAYIKVTNPPPIKVKLKLETDVKPNKVQENLETGYYKGESFKAPLAGGYATIAESFGDDVYCRVSGNLIECPVCGRWASSKLTDDGEAAMRCDSCLFEDIFSITVTPEQTWAVIGVESLLQNEKTGRVRFFIPRLWNKGGPWIKYEKLKQKYETFCKERNDAHAESTATDRSHHP